MEEEESVSDIKQEYEEDLLEIVDNLKQEEQITEDTVSIQNEDKGVQFNCHMSENFVNVFNDAESSTTDIKTEIEEEDPLRLVDDSKQEVKNKHLKSVHCDQCDKSFVRKDALIKHIRSVHDNVRYNCNQCDKSFSHKGNLDKHIQSVHENIRFNCDKCDKSFSYKENLKRHIQSIHENVQFNCDKCNKSYSQKDRLNTHVKSVHDNVQTCRSEM